MIDTKQLSGLTIYPRSVTEHEGATYFLAQGPAGKVLGVHGEQAGFEGERHGGLLLAPLTSVNAAALRERLPWLRPRLLGLTQSAGCGDRLGLATPGHLRAVRACQQPAAFPQARVRQVADPAPILAQQSMRENARTGRTPQQVVDDAQWGVLQEGWRQGWGADADHLKTTEDIDLCAAAGYTFYTVDPGEHVDNEAHAAPTERLHNKVQALPWIDLEDSPAALQERYLHRSFEIEGWSLAFDESSLWRAAAKYGRAVVHTVRMYRHLLGKGIPFELEMSVDETETPTSVEEHLYVASELSRLGVQWVSLAPRYVGRFEKGVDYIGDLAEFEAELAKHAAIARVLGPYKLSIHTGSDKFSIYPIIARHTQRCVHLKTAGTSYLVALRALAQLDSPFFREILALAIERYSVDRLTYHVSAQLSKVPGPSDLSNAELPGLLDQFDAREVLHVTFGSVLDRFGARLLTFLRQHEETYDGLLEAHFLRHLLPFLDQERLT